MTTRSLLQLAALCMLVSGCRQNYVDADNDRLPLAVAQAIDTTGKPVDSTVNGGLGPIYPFTGEPVEVVLDGSDSSDIDGKIVGYRWLGTDIVDGGAGRKLPEGEEPGWPDDTKQPRVLLGEGRWSFSLWVTDDDGAISQPSAIHLIVGDAPVTDAGPPKGM